MDYGLKLWCVGKRKLMPTSEIMVKTKITIAKRAGFLPFQPTARRW
jgi:hypothetical protein